MTSDDAPTGRTVAVLLAAGAGTRWDDEGHKLLAPLAADDQRRRPAETVFERSVASVLAADVGPVVVVAGALGARRLRPLVDRVRAATLPHPARDPVVVVDNPAWADGQMTSVRCGILEAGRWDPVGVVVGLADQPGIEPDAWRRVASGLREAPIAVATYDGARGNPVGLRSDVWSSLPEGGDEGARALMRVRPELVGEVPCSGSPADIDTVEDLRRWQNN